MESLDISRANLRDCGATRARLPRGAPIRRAFGNRVDGASRSYRSFVREMLLARMKRATAGPSTPLRFAQNDRVYFCSPLLGEKFTGSRKRLVMAGYASLRR